MRTFAYAATGAVLVLLPGFVAQMWGPGAVRILLAVSVPVMVWAVWPSVLGRAGTGGEPPVVEPRERGPPDD